MTEILFAALVLLVAAGQMLWFNLHVSPSVKKIVSFWLFWLCFIGALVLVLGSVKEALGG